MKRVPWLIVGVVVGAVLGGLSVPAIHSGQYDADERFLEAMRPLFGAGVGLMFGLLIDLWEQRARKGQVIAPGHLAATSGFSPKSERETLGEPPGP